MNWTVVRYDGEWGVELWFVCYAGDRVFRADKESDAAWLADFFNRMGTVPPAYRQGDKTC